jgi:hypothetical protein
VSDVVVTVPRDRWQEWLREGDLAGQRWSGQRYEFRLRVNGVPKIVPGERVYIVARGRLRGYAPLLELDSGAGEVRLIRGGEAVAVTIPFEIGGFQGFRYRWWERRQEQPFAEWRS